MASEVNYSRAVRVTPGILNTTLTGAVNNTPFDLNYFKVGEVFVRLQWSTVIDNAIAASSIVLGDTLPLFVRPSVNIYQPIIVHNNSTEQIGIIEISTDGTITIRPDIDFTGTFLFVGNCGILSGSVVYGV